MNQNKKEGGAQWLEDFRIQCEEQGADFYGVLKAAGYSNSEIGILQRKKVPTSLDKLILERELISYGAPPQPTPEVKAEMDKKEPKPEPDSPVICDGDNIHCPYLTYTAHRKGYCPLQKCGYIVKEDKND